MIIDAPGLELDAATLRDIGVAVDTAYDEGARYGTGFYKRSEVHYKPLCTTASKVIVSRMTARGYSVQEDEARVFETGEADDLGIYHSYCVLGDIESPEAVIDATWQQFLSQEQRTEGVPKVLIGTREAVQRVAASRGIAKRAILDLWLPPSEREELHGRFDNRVAYL